MKKEMKIKLYEKTYEKLLTLRIMTKGVMAQFGLNTKKYLVSALPQTGVTQLN